MPNTTGGRYYALDSDDANEIGTYTQQMAEREDEFFVADLLTNQPASPATPPKPGRRFYATDTGDTFQDTGSAWVHIASSARCEFAAGTPTSIDGFVDLGTLGFQGLPGFYSEVSNAAILPAAGRYRITARIAKAGAGGAFTVQIATGVSAQVLYIASGSAATTFTLATEARTTAADSVAVVGATTGSDTLQVLDLSIVRVGP